MCRSRPPEGFLVKIFKNLNDRKFRAEDFIFNSDNPNENNELIRNVFSNIVEKHASLEKKFWGEIRHLSWLENSAKLYIIEVD